jgi:hypothetical protein
MIPLKLIFISNDLIQAQKIQLDEAKEKFKILFTKLFIARYINNQLSSLIFEKKIF